MTETAYPPELEADIVLRDGSTARLRPVTPDDADLLVAFYSRVSEESKYYRFFAPHPELSESDIVNFTGVDYDSRMAFIVLVADAMVAIGRYDAIGDGSAEVAFLVEDDFHGRGLGPLLLEHLAEAARERGIHQFVAEVLPDNRKMITVFTEIGFAVHRVFADGVVEVRFDISPTSASRQVQADRERRFEAASIARLMDARSIAVVGASRRPGKVGYALMQHLVDSGFPRPIHQVNPAAAAEGVAGAYARLADVPGDVDLVLVATAPRDVDEIVREAADKHARGLVVVSSGFAEASEAGAELQRRLVARARAFGMRVVGPNCLGMINTATPMNASLASHVPDPGRVAFFCHSGALGVLLLEELANRGIGLSSFVSAGNRADVSGNDLMQYWYADDATDVVVLYLESLGNPRKFSRVARELAVDKPVVVLKTGSSSSSLPTGHRIRRQHVPAKVYDAMFRQSGVIAVASVAELLDVTQLLSTTAVPAGERLGVIGNSDSLTRLAVEHARRLAVPTVVHWLEPNADDAQFAAAAAELSDQVDALLVIHAPLVPSEVDVLGAIDEALRDYVASGNDVAPIPVMAVFGPGGRAVDAGRRGTGNRGVVLFGTPEAAVGSFAKLAGYHRWRAGLEGSGAQVPELVPAPDSDAADAFVADVLGSRSRPVELSGADLAPLLAAYGIAEPKPGARSDGAVLLRIRTMEDASFGPVIGLGMAGVPVDVFEDEAFRIPPLSRADAFAMLHEPRAATLYDGSRGPSVNLDALASLLHRTAALALDQPELDRLALEVEAAAEGICVRSATARIARALPRQDVGVRRLSAQT